MKDKTKKTKIKREHKYSIRRRLTITIISCIVVAFLTCWLANVLFLERIYLKNTRKNIENLHDLIYAACNDNVADEAFLESLQIAAANQNVSVVIADLFLNPIIISTNEPSDRIYREFLVNIQGLTSYEKLIAETDEYIFVYKKDMYSSKDLLEMWGKLPGDKYFMIRTTLVQLRDSADVANKLLMNIGIVASLISGIIIYFITGRISKPILELANISEKMSKMDFDTKYTGKRKDEIGVLGRSINEMSSNLESTIIELKNANFKLQNDIDEKTKLDEMRKEFVSSVSHELKTPIALIQGYAEGLKEGIAEAEERDYYCDVIIDEAIKMNALVKKIISLNQLEAGASNLSITRFDIVELINNYAKSIDILLRQNDINISLPESEPVYVWADEMNIEEVVMNYLSNAINHCESDTSKHIDVCIQKEENENVVKVSVINTGKNIPDESLDHLWDKFYKVDKARTREYGGSGLGLSIVKAIMEAHNQRYGVNNLEGGVEFWFTLDASYNMKVEEI